MTTVTLEHIAARQDELAELIQQLKADQPRQVTINETTITLAKGEHYAGVLLAADGTPSHHLVLLPGSAEDITFDKAQQWAIEQGGDLPTRQEQSLLFANLKGKFEAAHYWSGQQHETDSSWAWCQYFHGRQPDHQPQGPRAARSGRPQIGH